MTEHSKTAELAAAGWASSWQDVLAAHKVAEAAEYSYQFAKANRKSTPATKAKMVGDDVRRVETPEHKFWALQCVKRRTKLEEAHATLAAALEVWSDGMYKAGGRADDQD